MKCPECNGEVEFVAGDFRTGVVAPDGYEERHWEEGFYCDRCKHVFEETEVSAA